MRSNVALEKKSAELPTPKDMNEAVRVLRDLDRLLPDANETVVIIDELEVLREDQRQELAHLIKEIGDQEINTRFVLVGIGDDVQQLIGLHPSVPRYLKEVELNPLPAQYLMDIVSDAAEAVDVDVNDSLLKRIAVIGNGYPHFSHLIGKAILTEAIRHGCSSVDATLYASAIQAAVRESIQELRVAYEAAAQRRDDVYKRTLWAMAHSDVVDMRTDEIEGKYAELARAYSWPLEPRRSVTEAIGLLKRDDYGSIVINTPVRYGGRERRYRYHRFAHSLMRGHVRLQADAEAGVLLGRRTTL